MIVNFRKLLETHLFYLKVCLNVKIYKLRRFQQSLDVKRSRSESNPVGIESYGSIFYVRVQRSLKTAKNKVRQGFAGYSLGFFKNSKIPYGWRFAVGKSLPFPAAAPDDTGAPTFFALTIHPYNS